MYATIRHYSGSSELADALIENENDVRQLLTGIGGFRAYYLVRAGADATASVSVFDDAAGAQESTRVAAEWLRENLPGLAIGAPEVTAGDVVLSF